mgnify:CR=1 FL=1
MNSKVRATSLSLRKNNGCHVLASSLLIARKTLAGSIFVVIWLSSFACTEVDVLVSKSKPPHHLRCDPTHLSLGLVGENQENDTWCWASSAKSILGYFEYGDIRQCELVSQARKTLVEQATDDLGPNLQGRFQDCCAAQPIPQADSTGVQDPMTVAVLNAYVNVCLAGGMPEEIFNHYSINYQRTAIRSVVSWNELQYQLCEWGPMIFIVEWLGGGLHTGITGGYQTTNIPGYKHWVEIDDHVHVGFFLKPYDEFVYDPTEHRHYGDYINFRHGDS